MGRGGKRVSSCGNSAVRLTNLQSQGGGKGWSRGGGGGGRRDNRVSYDKIEKKNEKLEKYYEVVLNLSETEKTEFWAALRRELPNSFRFAGSKGYDQFTSAE